MENNSFITIGIPTYNRGDIALRLVKELINKREENSLVEDVEIFVTDNASEKGTDSYKEIYETAKVTTNFKYFRHNENTQFVGNMMNLIKNSSSRYCLITSDEDSIDFTGLREYIDYLKCHPEIVLMKGYTSKMYHDIKPVYAEAGGDAIDAFYLQGNYISGIIYNRSVLTSEVIDDIHSRYQDNNAYIPYPHMFWDTYCLLNGTFASSDTPLVIEGETAGDAVTEGGIYAYGYPEKRIEQGIGFLEQIKDFKLKDEMAVEMFIRVYKKTEFLLSLNRDGYVNTLGLDYSKIIEDARNAFLDRIYSMDFEAPELYEGVIRQFI